MVDDVVKRRARPRVAILDHAFDVLIDDARGTLDRCFLDAARQAVTSGAADVEVERDGEAHVVRVARLVGDTAMRYAVFVEPCGLRRPLIDAYDRFHLTPREVEVLALIIDGASNREIANALCIVEGTVQDHVRHLCAKSGSRCRGDLLARVFGVDGP